MKKYWVSWYSPADLWGKFELHAPWWVSGERCADGAHTICAAIQAENETTAMDAALSSYDEPRPAGLDWRFVEERPADWSPFNSRFPRADWMKWPEEVQSN